MMYNDVKAGDIPILSFLKGTDYAMYVGPELSPDQREILRNLDITIPVIYLPEILEGLSDAVIKYNFPGVTIPESLTVENIYALDAWLHSLCKAQPTGGRQTGLAPERISDAGVYNYHKRLKALINRAVRIGKIDINPYDRLRGEFKRGDKENVEYLTEEQMQKVMDISPVPGSQVAMARDLFIFQMYTGLGYADTQIFDLSQYREIDGKWRFVGKRVKTGVPYVSMLLPPVVDMLKRNGWRVPKMNNQRYNQMLKAIGMVIGIERLHSHMGRHTFATWMLSNGSKIENVSKMLGHTDIKMTQRYAEVLAKDVYDDFERVAKTIK